MAASRGATLPPSGTPSPLWWASLWAGWGACIVVMLAVILATLVSLAVRARRWARSRPVVAFFHPNRCERGRPPPLLRSWLPAAEAAAPHCHVRSLFDGCFATPCLRSNGGGGGERVLWLAIKAVADLLAAERSAARIVVYSGDSDVGAAAIVAKAQERFGVDLSSAGVEFCFIGSRTLLDPARYPVMTMVGQSLGGMLCVAECVARCPPEVFIDTMGAPFGYPVAALLAGATVATYTHYPVITEEMTRVVASRRAAHNNAVSGSALRTSLKLAYYRLFATAYARCGAFCDVIMANSSWTAGHLRTLWSGGGGDGPGAAGAGPRGAGSAAAPPGAAAATEDDPSRQSMCCWLWSGVFGLDDCVSGEVRVVFPPCNSEAMAVLPLAAGRAPAPARRLPWVVSVGQFRPEKDHPSQLRAFAGALERIREGGGGAWAADVKLVLVGGARNAADAARVDALKALAAELGIDHRVEWRVNAPFKGAGSLCEALELGAAGLHCMWNEHFGIGVVESQAAGCVIVAHDSGGPMLDIVVPFRGKRTGCRARSVKGYASALAAVLRASQEGEAEYTAHEEDGGDGEAASLSAPFPLPRRPETLRYETVQVAGREAALRFADVRFERDFVGAMRPALERVGVLAKTKAD